MRFNKRQGARRWAKCLPEIHSWKVWLYTQTSNPMHLHAAQMSTLTWAEQGVTAGWVLLTQVLCHCGVCPAAIWMLCELLLHPLDAGGDPLSDQGKSETIISLVILLATIYSIFFSPPDKMKLLQISPHWDNFSFSCHGTGTMAVCGDWDPVPVHRGLQTTPR